MDNVVKTIGQSSSFVKQRNLKAIAGAVQGPKLFTLPHNGIISQAAQKQVKMLTILGK